MDEVIINDKRNKRKDKVKARKQHPYRRTYHTDNTKIKDNNHEEVK